MQSTGKHESQTKTAMDSPDPLLGMMWAFHVGPLKLPPFFEEI